MKSAHEYAPTRRFSDRVKDYERYRPGYPPALTEWLLDRSGLQVGDTVADIGAGTGLFSRNLLAAGLRVLGVEPNASMRWAAERQFAATAGFVAIDGTAEHTTLAAGSVQLVTAAQAFHWFNPPAARAEFARILGPGGGVALIWNVRRTESAFAGAYERLLLTRCPDYADGVPEQAAPAAIAEFFGPIPVQEAHFDYLQTFDYEGLRGRLLSSSYTPKENDPARQSLLADLERLFDEYTEAGSVRFEYDTRAFFGRL